MHGSPAKFVSENDITAGARIGIRVFIYDTLVVRVDLFFRSITVWFDVPVVSISTPYNRSKTKLICNRTDTVIDVSKRRPPATNSDAKYIFENAYSIV